YLTPLSFVPSADHLPTSNLTISSSVCFGGFLSPAVPDSPQSTHTTRVALPIRRLHMEQPSSRSHRDSTSRQDLINHLPVDVRQAEIAAVVVIGQPQVVEAEQVQNRRVQVVNRDALDGRPVPDLVGFAVVDSALHSPARHPGGEGVWVVIASGLVA